MLPCPPISPIEFFNGSESLSDFLLEFPCSQHAEFKSRREANECDKSGADNV